MKSRLHILFAALCTLLSGCLDNVVTDDGYHRHLIVEGRIEAGAAAEVTLMYSLPYMHRITDEAIAEAVVRDARITVSCGDQTETLTAEPTTDYITGYVYRGHSILGCTGKSYSLRIEHAGTVLTAETTVPEPVALDEVTCEAVDDDYYTVRARFRDPADAKNAYLFECRTAETGYFRPALLGIIDDSLFPGQAADITVNRPINYLEIKDYTQYFRQDEVVTVRFSTLGSFGYDYWSAFEDEVVNALNPIFPADSNLPSNISGDGRGIWCGYASSTREVGPLK